MDKENKMLRSKVPIYSIRAQVSDRACAARTALRKAEVSVLFLSSTEQDNAVEKTLATLRGCKVSILVLHVPHHSADLLSG